jgi:hypothetical protein
MVIHTLKHTAFRLWAAILLAVPLSLWLLSLVTDSSGLATPLMVAAVSFLSLFMLSGWLGSQIALRLLPSIIYEAGVWERNGDIDKAEKAYRKALALYDSFLVSPQVRRRGIAPLVSRIARMYAAQTDKHAAAERFMEDYLAAYPEDREIAEDWLHGREYQAGLTPTQHDLALRIGDTHSDDAAIQVILARLYLRAERTDFPALQTYRRAMSLAEADAAKMAPELADVFLQEGRSDEWALPVYLHAAGQSPSSEALRRGIAACLRWIRPAERNADLLARAQSIIGHIDGDTLARMSSGFVPPTGSYAVNEVLQDHRKGAARSLPDRVWESLKRIDDGIRHVGQSLLGMILDRLKPSAGLRRTLTWSLIAGMGIAAAAFLINTVSHLTPTPVPDPRPELPPQIVAPVAPPMPYTLQVAAYLKPEHAQHYLENLRKQNLDAYVVQAHGNQKTWYQVRIAHFPDKDAARAFGSKLKAQGIIEDFYVATDEAP